MRLQLRKYNYCHAGPPLDFQFFCKDKRGKKIQKTTIPV